MIIKCTICEVSNNADVCAGMSLVAGLFLIVMSNEETAFWCLVSVMERGKYLLGYYDSHMERFVLVPNSDFMDLNIYN